jgi:predicted ATPase
MNNKFKLQNFRVFDNVGTEFEIAPITILTGCNSSGKSTAIKSMMLFSDLYGNLYEDYLNGNPVFLNQYELKFNTGKHNLGTYLSTLSKYSDSKEFVLGFSKYSNFFMCMIQVEFVIKMNEEDFLKNGVIKSIKISTIENEIIYLEVVGQSLNYRINALEVRKHLFEYYKCYQDYNQLARTRGRVIGSDDILYYRNSEEYKKDESFNHFNVDTCINSDDQIIKRDNVENMRSFLEQINGRFQSIFYLPILDWFGDAQKENITELVNGKINEFQNNSDDFKLIVRIIYEMIEDFKNSECKTVKEYYLSIENIILTDFSETLHYAYEVGKDMSMQDVNRLMDNSSSFIRVLYKLFEKDEHSIICGIMDAEAFINSAKTKEEKYYFALIKFCENDPDFDNRIIEKLPNLAYDNYEIYYSPKEVNAANLFLSSFLQECLISAPSFLTNIEFVDAVKANIQRMYTFKNQGTPFNELIQNYLAGHKKKSTNENMGYEIGTFLRKWINIFDIGDDVKFELSPDNLGVHIYIIKGEESLLLADEGYGFTQILAILLQIELNIANNPYKYNHPFVSGSEVRYKESTIAIEEPEINLHPKFQSLLADLYMDAYKKYNIHFIIETHSEYLVRKLQTLVAKKELTPNEISIHYIYHHDKSKRPAGKPQVKKIRIRDDGRLSEPFGSGFFDEADNLAMELLKLKSLN